MSEWKEFTGVLPPVLTGLGRTPIHYENAWWASRNDNLIMRIPVVGMGALDVNDADTQAAATAMNNALAAHGYRESDQGLYVAFQKDAGLTTDGFPGTNTMSALQTVLTAMSVVIAPVPIYPWLASGSYDGVNAPLLSQWAPSAPSGSSTLVTSNTSVSSTSLFGLPTWAVWVLGAAAAAGLGFVAWSLMSDDKKQHVGHATVHHLSHHRPKAHVAESRRRSAKSRRKSKRSRAR